MLSESPLAVVAPQDVPKARAVRRRTMTDRVISAASQSRFALIEPVRLRAARFRHEGEYASRDETPLITVMLPTFNRAAILLDRGVPTVLSQTYKNLELLIVGNTCTDDTAMQLSRISDPRLRFHNLPPRRLRHPDDAETKWLVGAADANNWALANARGKWVAWIGDDDIWTADHLEVLLRFAQDSDYEFVSGQNVEERYGERRVIDGARMRGSYHTRKPAAPNDTSPKIGGIPTWLYRSYLRFFRHNVQCWRKSWNRPVDTDLYLRMYQAGVRMGFLEQVLFYQLPRPGDETVGLDAYRTDSLTPVRVSSMEPS